MKKILAVDDSGMMLRTIMGWLEGHYEVALANSAAAAKDALAKDRPDMILLDYEMPDVSGADLLAELRESEEYANIPVFFLTSKSDTTVVMSVMTLKPEGFILKTTPPDIVLSTIATYFESH